MYTIAIRMCLCVRHDFPNVFLFCCTNKTSHPVQYTQFFFENMIELTRNRLRKKPIFVMKKRATKRTKFLFRVMNVGYANDLVQNQLKAVRAIGQSLVFLHRNVWKLKKKKKKSSTVLKLVHQKSKWAVSRFEWWYIEEDMIFSGFPAALEFVLGRFSFSTK